MTRPCRRRLAGLLLLGWLASPACNRLGAPSTSPADKERLWATLRAKGPHYRPRTRHLAANGAPKFINRLILESSPYLLQHAHNPVDWYPWGDEAFARARRENRPVLLSVGYSTCHWCHVMERESFEDEEIAAAINAHYVAIKVDREERPDVDAVYMKAVQALSGGGGWPMTLVLTPDRRPFFAATYLPARDGERGARKGFLSVLGELRALYHAEPQRVAAQARQLSEAVAEASAPARPGSVPGPQALEAAAHDIAASFDPVWGGFGGAPKFPRPVELEFLLRYHRRSKDARALHMVLHTLGQMAGGGIRDHVGGGFHRYATDERWLVPHFEKMLYDNAQLAMVYLEAFQAAGDAPLAAVARETLDYVLAEMTDPAGGFYAATDADSPTPQGHEAEGWFFTWTPAEIADVLDPAQVRLVTAHYGVTPGGNFEGRSILHVARPLPATGGQLAQARARLYAARQKRPPPLRDDKILTSWNGLTVSAFARAALVLGDDRYRQAARRAAGFVLERMRTPAGGLLRSHRGVGSRAEGYLDDYAFFIQALLDVFEATAEPRWLEQALALQRILDGQFSDRSGGGYFLTAERGEKLLARDKPDYDGAEPAGNSVALLNLLRLGELTTDRSYRTRAEAGFAAFAGTLVRAGRAVPKLLSALDFYLDRPLEVIVVRPPGGKPAGDEALLAELRRRFLPNRIVVLLEQGPPLDGLVRTIPLLEGKIARAGKTTGYVCLAGQCELPTSDAQLFARQLARVEPLHRDRAPAPLPATP